jgi:hypothetical protein
MVPSVYRNACGRPSKAFLSRINSNILARLGTQLFTCHIELKELNSKLCNADFWILVSDTHFLPSRNITLDGSRWFSDGLEVMFTLP